MLNTYMKITLLLATLSLFNVALAELPKTRIAANGITYMSGGIGHDEVLEMRPFAKNFTLNLILSEGAIGRSVEKANVNIYNEQDERIFRIAGAKPVLYVNLTAGTYHILATNNGQKLRHKFTIDGTTNQKIILNWKDEVAEDAYIESK